MKEIALSKSLHDRICELMALLDADSDTLLIELLKIKLQDRFLDFSEYDKLLEEKRGITLRGLNMTIDKNLNLYSEYPRYAKMIKIADNQDCYKCKYAVDKMSFRDKSNRKFGLEGFTYKDNDESNPVCISCRARCRELYDQAEYLKEIMNQKTNIVFEGTEINDLINAKTILSELKKKLKSYATS